jgi:hypothetical protein
MRVICGMRFYFELFKEPDSLLIPVGGREPVFTNEVIVSLLIMEISY